MHAETTLLGDLDPEKKDAEHVANLPHPVQECSTTIQPEDISETKTEVVTSRPEVYSSYLKSASFDGKEEETKPMLV